MDLVTLIELAAKAAGSQNDLAAEMQKQPARLSEWKKGKHQPDANEIAYLAKRAGLPVFQTVAEIETQLDSRYASIWREALGKLTAAGVAATVGTVMVMNPQNANASPSQANANHVTVCIM
ncbi:MAG: helix-turn-helix transcriptional regulator [Aquabacterium sp.]|nr:MAG: helix-turn-helix transcriptional regulator [Aquabacterium sp.]